MKTLTETDERLPKNALAKNLIVELVNEYACECCSLRIGEC